MKKTRVLRTNQLGLQPTAVLHLGCATSKTAACAERKGIVHGAARAERKGIVHGAAHAGRKGIIHGAPCAGMRGIVHGACLVTADTQAHPKHLCTDSWVKIQKQLHIDKWLLLTGLLTPSVLIPSSGCPTITLEPLSALWLAFDLLGQSSCHVSWRNFLQGGTLHIHTSQIWKVSQERLSVTPLRALNY